MKTLLCLLITIVALEAEAFDLPKKDPFYYQSYERGYLYSIPDKAQHFYGSQLLTELSGRLSFLPSREVTAPLLAFGIGLLWEIYQENQGLGFSERDLMADALGVIAYKANRGRTRMYLDYSTTHRTIIVNFGLQL